MSHSEQKPRPQGILRQESSEVTPEAASPHSYLGLRQAQSPRGTPKCMFKRRQLFLSINHQGVTILKNSRNVLTKRHCSGFYSSSAGADISTYSGRSQGCQRRGFRTTKLEPSLSQRSNVKTAFRTPSEHGQPFHQTEQWIVCKLRRGR